jgi:adenylyltransferase/sulfurtransferase
VGVGGLGAPAAAALASGGVGRLGLVDPDLVDVSNLHRQPLYGDADVGRPKVTVAAARLARLAPGLQLETVQARLGAEHATLVARYDAVVDGTDSIAAKFLLSDLALATGRPLVHAGVIGFRAQLMTILPGRSACYRCVFEEAPPSGEVPACEEAGVLGPLPPLIGALQAAEAIRCLAGRPPLFADRLLTVDLGAGGWRTVPLAPNPRCPACARTQPERATTRSEAR